MFLHAVLAAVALGPASAQQVTVPQSRAESTKIPFVPGQWLESIRPVDFNQWNKNHPGPHGGWFGPDADDCAKKYEITWGPLGIRTLMHDHTWAGYPAFRRAWPQQLVDANGELAMDCFEVVAVIPGSPADGHLQPGDLLVAMDGGVFRTAGALRPTQPPYKHQESRGLEMDAGERLDLAEARGRVSFDVLRPGAMPVARFPQPVGKDLQVSAELPRTPGNDVALDVPVLPGQELTVLLELTGAHNGSCGADLIEPRLEGPAGSLDLSKLRRLAEQSGYGSIRVGASQYQGKEVGRSIWFHAPGHLTWTVPPGYNRFKAVLHSHPAAAGYKARVKARVTPAVVPQPLAAGHKVVAFDIPKLGSYTRGYPINGDAKSAVVAKMTAAWLASHQQADGSWPRNVGYTHRGYDTAWAGLGLLAHADPAYDGAIRKAAEFIAFDCPQDGWAVPNGVMIMFLSEYWLRTKDDRVLVPLQNLVDKMRSEMVYGDWNGGHGLNPGYGGSGVSTGGSHLTLAFALAGLTPAKPEAGLVDKMLARAQELAPDGFIPYGRGVETREFKPNLDGAGTYSGRHGPYLVASMIHGGPRLFTENCTAMYTDGPVGGIDQGHATQTLSTSWALLAAASIDPKVLARHMEALRWKITMLRCHDGGFGWNAYRLEYQGGEGLLPAYLRAGAYLMVLNAHKRNLAMTGAPQWRAKTFPDLPPVCHDDAVALGYYQRNWGVAAAVLGNRSPAALTDGLAKLRAMGKGADTRGELFAFLKGNAESTARDILAIKDTDPLLPPYLAEMVLGVDVRLAVEIARKDDKPVPGKWQIQADVQHPLAGWFAGANKDEREAWRKHPPLPMTGSIGLLAADGTAFGGAAISIDPDCGNQAWQTQTLKREADGPAGGPLPLVARIRHTVGTLQFSYDRPITADGEEPGNGEKGRKVLGDRVVWVDGVLAQDLNGWNASFTLPGGQFISAATQGVSARVEGDGRTWVAPQDASVPAGSRCQFGYCSGWQFFEARVAAVRVAAADLEAKPARISAAGGELFAEALADHDPGTSQTISGNEILIELAAPELVRAVDLRLGGNDTQNLRLKVYADVNGTESLVLLGRTSGRCAAIQPVTTAKLRLVLESIDNKPRVHTLDELRIIRAPQP